MHLLIDADDTLWEDAIYFREVVYTLAIHLTRLHHHSHDQILGALRQHLSLQQNIDINQHGLGPKCFFLSLNKVLNTILIELELEPHHDSLLKILSEIEHDFYHQPLVLRDNVAETLLKLSKEPYKLYLYTQGEVGHQQDKINRSALAHYFHEQVILPIKTVDNLRQILAQHKIPEEAAVIIGNSTRSDINPAKELGLQTIHCKHPYTWERENHPMIETGPKTHVVDNFADILTILKRITA